MQKKILLVLFLLVALMIVKNQAVDPTSPSFKTMAMFRVLLSYLPEAKDYVIGPRDFVVLTQPRSRSEYLAYLMNTRISADVMQELLSPITPYSQRLLHTNFHSEPDSEPTAEPKSPPFTQNDVVDLMRLSYYKGCINLKGDRFFRRSTVPFGFKLFLSHLEGMSLTRMLREHSMVEEDKLKVIFLRRLQHVESTLSFLESEMMGRFYFLTSSDISTELIPHNNGNVERLTALSFLNCVEQEFNRRDLELGVKEGLLTFLEVDSSDLIDKEYQTLQSIEEFLEAKPLTPDKLLDPRIRKSMFVKVPYKPKEGRGKWRLSDRVENYEQFIRDAIALNQQWRSFSSEKLRLHLKGIAKENIMNIPGFSSNDEDRALCHHRIDQELQQYLLSSN